ncbi:Bardet-Biedl syndrome 1 protein [Ixodes scapularis]
MLDPDEREAFVQANRDFPLKKQTVVTALSTLKKSMAEEDSPSCLLLATEDGRVYVLEPDAFTILAAVQVASAPTFLDGQGLFDVDYHVAVACRDARLYIIKRGHKAAKLLAEPGAAAVGLCHLEGQLVVACTDDVLRAYSIKSVGATDAPQGQRLWSVPLSGQPLCVSPVCRPGVSLQAVALRGRTVALHRSGDGAAVDSLDTDDDVSAMRFGRLGREENALVLVGTGGGLTVLILKRGAQLQKEPVATPTPGPAKWSLPKKTKLFVDQTMREREHSVAMHRSFQRDLQRLRVTAARHYARALGSNLQPVSAPNQGHSLELSAQVQGLGPEYLLHLRLQNSRPGPVPTDLSVVIHSDPSLYKVARPILRVPYLVPGLVYRLSTRVSCLVESGLSDVLKVLVTRGGAPVVTALVQMPSTEA